MNIDKAIKYLKQDIYKYNNRIDKVNSKTAKYNIKRKIEMYSLCIVALEEKRLKGC